MIGFIIACAFLISTAFLILLTYFIRGNIKIEKTLVFIGILFAGCSFAYIAFCIIPDPQWDLYRHFEEIDKLRPYGIKFALTSGKYARSEILSEIYMWIISRLPVNGYFQAIAIVVDTLIVAYIVSDYRAERYLSLGRILLSILIILSFSSILLIMSGVRNETASFIVSLAVYIDLYKGKGIAKSWFLYLIACLIHLAVVPVIIIRMTLLSPLFFKRVLYLMLLTWSYWGLIIGKILMLNSNNILRTLGYRAVNSFQVYAGEWDFYICRFLIFMILVLIIFSCFFRGSIKKLKCPRYQQFMFNYLLFTLGSIGSMQMLSRMFYPIAIMGIPYISNIFIVKNNHEKLGKVLLGIFIAVMLMNVYYQIRVIRRIELPGCYWVWEVNNGY